MHAYRDVGNLWLHVPQEYTNLNTVLNMEVHKNEKSFETYRQRKRCCASHISTRALFCFLQTTPKSFHFLGEQNKAQGHHTLASVSAGVWTLVSLRPKFIFFQGDLLLHFWGNWHQSKWEKCLKSGAYKEKALLQGKNNRDKIFSTLFHTLCFLILSFIPMFSPEMSLYQY